MEFIGNYLIYQMKPTPVIGRDGFKYYLTPSELLNYKNLYDSQEHQIKRRYPELFITHYFVLMRQSVYMRAKAIAYKGLSDDELRKIIVDFEKEYAKENGFEYLGIENKIRREAILRNIKPKK